MESLAERGDLIDIRLYSEAAVDRQPACLGSEVVEAKGLQAVSDGKDNNLVWGLLLRFGTDLGSVEESHDGV